MAGGRRDTVAPEYSCGPDDPRRCRRSRTYARSRVLLGSGRRCLRSTRGKEEKVEAQEPHSKTPSLSTHRAVVASPLIRAAQVRVSLAVAQRAAHLNLSIALVAVAHEELTGGATREAQLVGTARLLVPLGAAHEAENPLLWQRAVLHLVIELLTIAAAHVHLWHRTGEFVVVIDGPP